MRYLTKIITKNKIKKILIFFLFVFTSLSLIANDLPERPIPPRLVNDFANILTQEEKTNLEAKLVAFNNSTSTQIAIVIVDTLFGYEISDYSFKLGEKWGIGQKDESNGILVLIKQKTSSSGGKIFIAIGYGLEEIITDAATRMIIEKDIIPHFKEDDYYGGIDAGITILMDLASKKYTSSEYVNKKNDKAPNMVLVILFVCLIIFIIICGSIKHNKKSGGGLTFGGGSSGGDSSWGGSSGGGSSWGGSSGGDSSWGGSSGGGFGGFGGGHFGGGGAGGSW